MTLHNQYLDVILLTDLRDKLPKSGFHAIDKKNLPSVARAEDNVIIYHGNSCFCVSILLIHVSILA